jgi:glycosyltransferase involved in cell wall biosynthesis
MRILHVTDVYLPALGGIEVLVGDLGSHQRQVGHQVRILTATPGEATEATQRVKSSIQSPISAAISAFGPDVVHCHSSIISPLAWRAARSAALAGLPVLVTMHSIVRNGVLLPAILHQLATAMPKSVLWSAVSRTAAQILEPVVGRPVLALASGMDTSTCLPARAGTHTLPTIISVMRLSRRKRPLALIDILTDLDRRMGEHPWQAVVVGDGPQEAAILRAIRRARLSDHVRLTGRLTRPQIMRLLARADLYLAPAYLESFGIAALEARCSGVPVLAMRSSGVGEFVQDGEHGHLVEDDAEMAAVAARLLTDPAELRRMGQRGLADPADVGSSSWVERTTDAYRAAGAVIPRAAVFTAG